MENENLFWTVFRAPEELDGIRTTKMTGTLSSFQKRKNHFEIFKFEVAILRKTRISEREKVMKFKKSDPKYRKSRI